MIIQVMEGTVVENKEDMEVMVEMENREVVTLTKATDALEDLV